MVRPVTAFLFICVGGALGFPQGRAPGWASRGTGRDYMERTESGVGNEKGYPQPKGPAPPPSTTPSPPPCAAGQGYLIAALSTALPGGDDPPKGYQPPACPPPATTTTTTTTSTTTSSTTTTQAPTTPPCPGGGGYLISALSAPQTGEVGPPKGYQPPACPPPTTPPPTPPPCPQAGALIAAPPGVKGYAPPACPPPATTTTTTTTTEPPCVRTTTAAPCPYRATPSPCPCAQTTTVAPCNQPTTTLPPVVTSPHSKGYPQPHPNSLQRSSRVSSSLVGLSPPAGVSSSFISDPQPAGVSSLAARRTGQIRFYQSFQPRGDPAILSAPQHLSLQSSYSGGARRDSARIRNIQSDQPHSRQVEMGTRGQHLRQEVVDQVLLSSDQEVRRSLNRLLGSSIYREHQNQSARRPSHRQSFPTPQVRRYGVQQDEEEEKSPEEVRLSDWSRNAPVSG